MSYREKSKFQHRVSHQFRELDRDDFESSRDYEEAKRRLKRQMKNTRKNDRFHEMEEYYG